LHREDGPAVIRANGDMEWWIDGQLHREGAPAVIRSDASFWFCHHRCHREDGPAIERADGSKEWKFQDLPHREDGPCTIMGDGFERGWAIHGKLMSAAEHAKYCESRTTPTAVLVPCTLTVPKLMFAKKT